MIKRRVREAEISPDISNHSFRRTRITEYLRNGGDLETAALGWPVMNLLEPRSCTIALMTSCRWKRSRRIHI